MQNPQSNRTTAMLLSKLKASAVVTQTIGLTIGAASKKVTLWETLKPFCIIFLITGTLPHSQTGTKKPKMAGSIWAKIRFLGIIFKIHSLLTNTSTKVETVTPIMMKGKASTQIETTRVTKFCRSLGRFTSN